MLIFVNGNNEIEKNNFLKKLPIDESLYLLEYNSVYDKIFRIMRIIDDKYKIYIVKNSLDYDKKDYEYKFKNNMISFEDKELFDKYYKYFNEKTKDCENIKNLNVNKFNIKVNLDIVNSNLLKINKREEAKWLTGC